jgi:hypothetical protein
MDYITDNNFKGLHLFKKLAGDNTPAFFDDSLPSQEDIEKLPSSLFADPINREYPIDTPKNTYLSALYMYTDGMVNKTASAHDIEIKKAIKLAGAMHGISDDIDKLSQTLGSYILKTANEAKVANNTKKFAYISGDTGYFPTNTPEEIIKASRDIADKFNDLPLPIVKVASENILNAYNQLSEEERKAMPLTKTVQDYGNLYVKDCYKVAHACAQRFTASQNPLYKELGEVALTEGKDNTVMLEKMASAIYELDVKLGLDKEYGKTLVDPFIAGNTNITIKEAAEHAANYVQMFEQLIPFTVFNKEIIKQNIKVACTKQASDALLAELNSESPSAERFEAVIDSLNQRDQAALYNLAYRLG